MFFLKKLSCIFNLKHYLPAMNFLPFIIVALTLCISCNSQKQSQNPVIVANGQIKTGADQTEEYLPLLKGKRVAILANLTTIIGKTHLVDSLKSLGVNIVKVFG